MLTNPLSPQLIVGRSTSALPLPLRLPDDDQDAMTMLSNFHHRHASLPDNPSLESLVSLAVIADKYDCVALLASSVALRMKPHILQLPSETRLCDLLALTCLFNDSWGFKAVTAQLLMVTSGSHWCPEDGHLVHRIPKPVLSESMSPQNNALY